MKPRPKPAHRSGNKNIYCPFYGACLDHAAKRYWQNWDCSECPHKLKQQPLRRDQWANSAGPYSELPWRICTSDRQTGRFFLQVAED
ncbi:MAG: hypothetical protein IMF18_07835 [Proteobacteria bacterium]|nr:hypothetical protein [Pseudomonadota bacterium]